MLARDRVFVALTRPQMVLGVTYAFLILNAVITLELFLISKSAWVFLVAALLHGVGWAAHLHDPRILDIWIARVSNCPRTRDYKRWGCNSYLP